MKFVTYQKDGLEQVGLVEDKLGCIIDIHKSQLKVLGKQTFPQTMIAAVELGDSFLKDLEELLTHDTSKFILYPFKEVELLAPIPRPRKNIFCVGKNYAAHAIEMGSAADIPEYPIIFSKTPTTVIGTEQTVLHHRHITECLDYEGELAVIIGKTAKGIKKEEAFDYVFGYTIINDITARDKQKRHQQYLLGKSLDTSCPMGPYITHKSVVGNPHQLDIETKVNGEIRQKANTEQFIFDIPTIISVISEGTTLEAGDIIATGTPAGVGDGFNPPRYLSPGDVIEITVVGVGSLKNFVQKDV